jgi:hypothetical protein
MSRKRSPLSERLEAGVSQARANNLVAKRGRPLNVVPTRLRSTGSAQVNFKALVASASFSRGWLCPPGLQPDNRLVLAAAI